MILVASFMAHHCFQFLVNLQCVMHQKGTNSLFIYCGVNYLTTLIQLRLINRRLWHSLDFRPKILIRYYETLIVVQIM